MIKEFIAKFTNNDLIGEDFTAIENEFYLISKELKTIYKRIEKKPIYIGAYLGKTGANKFIPSLWLLQLINKNSEKKVLVNNKGEWMFICGRDIMKESVLDISKIDKNELVLVVNKYGECIGVGILKDENKCFIKNYFDIGDFLRRERKAHLR